jgi:hypothetical protein
MADFESRIKALGDMEKTAIQKAGPLKGSWCLEASFSVATPSDMRNLDRVLEEGFPGNPDIRLQKVVYDRAGLWRIGAGSVNLRIGLGFYAGNPFETKEDSKQSIVFASAHIPPEHIDGVMIGEAHKYTGVEWLRDGDPSKTPVKRLTDALVKAFMVADRGLAIYGPERQLLWPLQMTEDEMAENYELLHKARKLREL